MLILSKVAFGIPIATVREVFDIWPTALSQRKALAMIAGSICTREVDVAARDENVWQAAIRMRQRAVGTLVIVNEANEPMGIVTDRDLMERVLAEAKDPRQIIVEDVMTRDPTTIGEDEPMEVALPRMRRGGFRRLPVVDRKGSLVGLLSMDDVLMRLADDISQVGQLIRRETPRGVAEEPVL